MPDDGLIVDPQLVADYEAYQKEHENDGPTPLEERDPELGRLLINYVEAYIRKEVPPLFEYLAYLNRTTGRNDPCWCDSGIKFKKCHGKGR